MRRLLGRVYFLTFLATGASGAVTGCYGDGASAPSTSAETTAKAEKASTGSLAVDLVVVGGVGVDSVSYTITGPGSFTKTGSIDASASQTLSAQIGGLPAATGYSIALSATATDGVTTCSGSQSFDVTAHATSNATVALDCHEPPKKGSVLFEGVANICPVVDSVSGMPNISEQGMTVMLDAAAHDSDDGPSPLTYRWSATSGTLSTGSGASTMLTCTDPVLVTITVSVSDGDPNPTCAASMTTVVSCIPSDSPDGG
ncbi:MAG TPA: hypothetical protein VHC69_05185 [Polyangiaceae bacterium]|nr:hypothetical protein [Polyangiaceae bacterium]